MKNAAVGEKTSRVGRKPTEGGWAELLDEGRRGGRGGGVPQRSPCDEKSPALGQRKGNHQRAKGTEERRV